MSTKHVTVCDYCGEIIRPRGGVSVQGNIYVVGGGGLVGNNIIAKDDDSIGEVKTSDYHFECLQKVLSVSTDPLYKVTHD